MEILVILVVLILGLFVWKLFPSNGFEHANINSLGRSYIRHLDYVQKVGILKGGEKLTKIQNQITALGYDTNLILTEYGDAKIGNRAPDYSKCKQKNA